MHDYIPYVSCLADLIVHLLLLKSSMAQRYISKLN